MLSGITSVILLTLIKKFILNAKKPLRAGLLALPIIYGLTIFINVLSVTLNGSKREWNIKVPLNFLIYFLDTFLVLAMEHLKMWEVFALSIGIAIGVAIFCQLFIVPLLRKRILSDKESAEPKMGKSQVGDSSVNVYTVPNSTVSLDAPVLTSQKEASDGNVNKLFHFLQTLTAVFSSFAHGGNDVRWGKVKAQLNTFLLNRLILVTQLVPWLPFGSFTPRDRCCKRQSLRFFCFFMAVWGCVSGCGYSEDGSTKLSGKTSPQ